jgi:DNA-3-methyladenine glycosylase I
VTSAKIPRCPWPGIEDPLYARYHDEEWGVPHADDRRLFEKMILEGFQAGLSWLTILKKRENFRKAFHNFDAKKMARYTEKDFTRLMNDAGIIRNRLKIEAARDNARAYLKLSERTSFATFIWSHMEDGSIQNKLETLKQAPAETEISRRISKALKKEGFRFVGPTTVYAFMQSSGMVNDHLVSCPRYSPCTKLQRVFKPPRA